LLKEIFMPTQDQLEIASQMVAEIMAARLLKYGFGHGSPAWQKHVGEVSMNAARVAGLDGAHKAGFAGAIEHAVTGRMHP
jgi:hypothetical protein